MRKPCFWKMRLLCFLFLVDEKHSTYRFVVYLCATSFTISVYHLFVTRTKPATTTKKKQRKKKFGNWVHFTYSFRPTTSACFIHLFIRQNGWAFDNYSIFMIGNVFRCSTVCSSFILPAAPTHNNKIYFNSASGNLSINST